MFPSDNNTHAFYNIMNRDNFVYWHSIKHNIYLQVTSPVHIFPVDIAFFSVHIHESHNLAIIEVEEAQLFP